MAMMMTIERVTASPPERDPCRVRVAGETSPCQGARQVANLALPLPCDVSSAATSGSLARRDPSSRESSARTPW